MKAHSVILVAMSFSAAAACGTVSSTESAGSTSGTGGTGGDAGLDSGPVGDAGVWCDPFAGTVDGDAIPGQTRHCDAGDICAKPSDKYLCCVPESAQDCALDPICIFGESCAKSK
jgi:hypothetical protein